MHHLVLLAIAGLLVEQRERELFDEVNLIYFLHICLLLWNCAVDRWFCCGSNQTVHDKVTSTEYCKWHFLVELLGG